MKNKKVTVLLLTVGIIITVLGILFVSITPIVSDKLGLLKFFSKKAAYGIIFMFLATGLGVTLSGVVTVFSSFVIRKGEKSARGNILISGLYILSLGVGAFFYIKKSPVPYIILAIALIQLIALLFVKTVKTEVEDVQIANEEPSLPETPVEQTEAETDEPDKQ